jgi:hypothetical protein
MQAPKPGRIISTQLLAMKARMNSHHPSLTSVPPVVEEMESAREYLETELQRAETVLEEKEATLAQLQSELADLEESVRTGDTTAIARKEEVEGKISILRGEIKAIQQERDYLKDRLIAVLETLYSVTHDALELMEQALRKEIQQDNEILHLDRVIGRWTLILMAVAIIASVFGKEIVAALPSLMNSLFRSRRRNRWVRPGHRSRVLKRQNRNWMKRRRTRQNPSGH